MGADFSPPPGYRDATWDQCAAEPETAIHLDHLPRDVRFEESTPEPIRFDPEKHMLRYRGYMYHGSFAYLRGLSRDSNYLLAIDNLYVMSSQPKKQFHLSRWLSAGAAAVILVGAVSAWKIWN